MNKTYISVLVLVLVAGGLFFVMKGKKLEAPTGNNNTPEVVTPANPVVPVPPTGYVQPVKEFLVTGKNYSFTPTSLSVNKGDKVRITFLNGNGSHDFRIDEYSIATAILSASTESTVEFTADKAGTFEYYCSVGNHRAQGMKGTLVVN